MASQDSQSGSAAGDNGGRAQTTEERRASIDKRFDDSLGSFDSQLRKEQEKNAQERDARNAANIGTVPVDGAGSADSSDETTKTEGDLASGGTAGTEGPNDDAKGKSSDKPRRPGDLKSDKDSKAGNTSGSRAPGAGAGATEIPDGSDDDVVARRLRKAAEAETDPELKERLWKEYIEYKKNAK